MRAEASAMRIMLSRQRTAIGTPPEGRRQDENRQPEHRECQPDEIEARPEPRHEQ